MTALKQRPLVLDEMLWVITEAIKNQPRSLQRRIGPSQMGTPCLRKLGHRINDTPPARDLPPAWKPAIGTAVHAWLTEVFDNANKLWPDSPARWLTDLLVSVGQVDGQEITGHLDLFDTGTETVIDWKIVGDKSLAAKRRKGPGQEYRTQLHLYAKGAIVAGMPVQHVGLLALPNSGELASHWYWTEPYNEALAQEALDRATAVAGGLRVLGPEILAGLPTADDFCSFCPYFVPNATDLTVACPGANAGRSQSRTPVPPIPTHTNGVLV